MNGWTSTFTQLVAAYPSIKFFAAEYGPMERQINDVVFALPPAQGMGTFNWEPTTQGDWNKPQATDPSSVTTPRAVPALGQHLHGPARPVPLRPDEEGLRGPALGCL